MLVTGASRGIGAATALAAAREGYAVGVNYLHNAERADTIVASIQRDGGRAVAIRGDVASDSEVVRMFEQLDRTLGAITALVNNAGILELQQRVDAMDAARLTRILATNVTGSFICAREAIRRMSTRHGGTGGAIVNVSSAAARLGSPGEYVDYAASKGAIDTFTLGLAREVANEGIRVNGVRPGIIYTDIHASGGVPDRVERLKENIPMRRGGDPEEVAAAILWLLSDGASYVTGSTIDVTGGR